MLTQAEAFPAMVEMLQKSAETYREFAIALDILDRPVMAAAARVSEKAIRDLLKEVG